MKDFSWSRPWSRAMAKRNSHHFLKALVIGWALDILQSKWLPSFYVETICFKVVLLPNLVEDHTLFTSRHVDSLFFF